MSNIARRHFVTNLGAGLTGVAVYPQLLASAVDDVALAVAGREDVPPDEMADDETFWASVRRAFDPPRGVTNLDHGNINPAPRAAIEDLVRHVRFAQPFPAKRNKELNEEAGTNMWPRVAQILGVHVDEIAFVRNATEALDTVLLGVPMRPGDEVVCSAHDYYAMLDALEQRRARDGVVLRIVRPPVPLPSLDTLAELYERELGPRTRLVLVTHPSNLTGQLAPVRRIADSAHSVGAQVVVDGAQSLGLLPYTMADLGCDFYGASLHKWLMGPVGGGVLWMRKENADRVWPLVPPPQRARGLQRFSRAGAYPIAIAAAIAPALTLHERLGGARKGARMRYLTSYWRRRVERIPGVRFYTNPSPDTSCGLATFEMPGVNAGALERHLWEHERIFVQDVSGDPRAPEILGIRVTPNVYTAPAELDLFAEAIERIALRGLG